MVLLVILALLWIAVLAPGMFKRYTERRGSESIDHFQHELHLLERSGPKLNSPINSLRVVESSINEEVIRRNGLQKGNVQRRTNLVLLKPVSDSISNNTSQVLSDLVEDENGTHFERVGKLAIAEHVNSPAKRIDLELYRHKKVLKRRRDIFYVLVGSLVGSALLGSIGVLRAFWDISILSLVLLVAYIAIMAYAQSLELEQHSRYSARARRDISGNSRNYRREEYETYGPRYASYDHAEDEYIEGDEYEYESGHYAGEHYQVASGR